jgi:hypothetical protein
MIYISTCSAEWIINVKCQRIQLIEGGQFGNVKWTVLVTVLWLLGNFGYEIEMLLQITSFMHL